MDNVISDLTNLMSSLSLYPLPTSRFLSLPAEVRLKIYQFVFGGVIIDTIQLSPDQLPYVVAYDTADRNVSPYSQSSAAAMLLVNKQIRTEAVPIHWEQVLVKLQSFSYRYSTYYSPRVWKWLSANVRRLDVGVRRIAHWQFNNRSEPIYIPNSFDDDYCFSLAKMPELRCFGITIVAYEKLWKGLRIARQDCKGQAEWIQENVKAGTLDVFGLASRIQNMTVEVVPTVSDSTIAVGSNILPISRSACLNPSMLTSAN